MGVAYASSSGTSWNRKAIPAGASIAPGHYYLIQLSGPSSPSGAALPTPDMTASIDMSGTSGKVILTGIGTSIPAEACPSGSNIVDHVGYGSANCGTDWGSAPTLSGATAALRKDGGCAYTGRNDADFEALAPDPRNSASAPRNCDGATVPEPASVSVTPTDVSLDPGATQAFVAIALDADDQPVGTSLTWESSNIAVATVNGSGVVTALAEGETVITVTTANGKSATAHVTVNPAPVVTPNNDVVISQVYGGGGNGGATFNRDFVELFNRGTTAVVIDGWSVQYASASGTSWAATSVGTATLQPGQYYLVALATGTNGIALPTPDASGGTNMSGTSGKVLLSRTGTPLAGACPTDAVIADHVNYGSGNCASWGTTSAPSNNTTSMLRADGGCTFTSATTSDFALDLVTPRNTTSPRRTCQSSDPGTPAAPGIVISEIMANPDGDDTQGEWFEVYNSSSADIDLQNWEIRSARSSGPDEVNVISAHVVVPAGGFAVIGNNANTLTNGGITMSYVFPGDFNLSNSITLSNSSTTEWLALHNASGQTADSVAYSPRSPTGELNAPMYTPSSGIAREVIDVTQDNAVITSGNWRDATLTFGAAGSRGTPGYGAYGTAGPVARIVIVPSPASVPQFASRTMTAVAVDALGRISSESLTWTSSDDAVASFGANGVVTGHVPGSVTITATAASGVQGQTTLTVVDADAPATVSVNVSESTTLVAGFQQSVFTSVRTADNRSVTVPLTYTVSDPNVLAIDVYEGRTYVRGVGAGTAEIRATAPNGVFGVRTMNILPRDVPSSAVYRNHIEFGTPTDADNSDDVIVQHPQFVSSYNPLRGGPNWVSWNLNETQFGSAPRCNCFSVDDALPDNVYKVNDVDYVNSGYDRGHMAQSESRTATIQENAATFLMTNMLPQAHENNAGPWLGFENFLDDLARVEHKEIYLVAGGEYAAEPATLKGQGKVAIPDYTWKVAVVMDQGKGLADVTGTSSLKVYAVRMPNLLSTAGSGQNWEPYQTTVDAIEAATGYDFLASLPDAIENIVEADDHAPTASTAATYAGIDGTAINFAGTGTDADANDALTYAWSFGDGATATGSSVSHTYAEAGSYTVLFIVTDSFGAADTARAVVTVAESPAPTAMFHSPASVVEGATIALSLSDVVGIHAPMTFAFDCGAGFSAFAAASAAECTTSDDGARTVRAIVRDTRGRQTEYTAIVNVTNANPLIASFAGATLLAGETYAATGTFTDAGADSWTATVNYDGATTAPLTLSGMSFQLSHAYAAAGTYTVSVIVTDDDGGADTQTATIVVMSAAGGANSLIATINAMQASGDIPAASASTFIKSLEKAAQSLAGKDNPSGVNQMNSFENQVRAAQNSGKISSQVAAALIAEANRIIASASH